MDTEARRLAKKTSGFPPDWAAGFRFVQTSSGKKREVLRGGVRVMALDERAVAETELHDDAPVILVDGKPVPPSVIQLVDGVFVDEAGRPAATVKHQTWY